MIRIHDPTDLELAVNEFAVHPLAVSSLSAAGSLALSTSLDGAIVAVDIEGGKVRGRVDTGRVAVGEGLGGESCRCWEGKEGELTPPELPAYAAALHPSSSAFAWSGRGSRLAIRSLDLGADDESGAGILSGAGSVVDLVKGRFGMDVQYVRYLPCCASANSC